MISTRERDRALLRRVAERDCDAASQLFDMHSDEIFGYLARRVGRLDAEDFLQEVFVRALRRASSFRGEATARTWLFAIARYVLLERSRDRLFAPELETAVAAGPGPESLLIRTEQAKHLLAALERLPDDQAIILELHEIDGLSHEEIATLLDISTATSRKRLQRANAALHGRLANGASAATSRHRHLDSWAHSLRLRRLEPESNP